MKGNVKLLICLILVILGVIMTIIAIGMSTVVNKDTIKENSEQKVVDEYTQLTVASGTNVDIRNKLTEKLNSFSNETYHEEHNDYTTLLNDYKENILTLKTYIEGLDEKCKKEYEDPRIKIMCQGSKLLYEESVNVYVATVKTYNSKINEYNETATTKYNEVELIIKDYIDYNKDNGYLGKPKDAK